MTRWSSVCPSYLTYIHTIPAARRCPVADVCPQGQLGDSLEHYAQLEQRVKDERLKNQVVCGDMSLCLPACMLRASPCLSLSACLCELSAALDMADGGGVGAGVRE
eukprot:GHVU01122483.1.p1 GENE.GHVU01122483.1~~GHVU01122483.1.p1  ORF type:complete len:106 (+),score=5.89 GHVU01122483.1:31-348(+)